MDLSHVLIGGNREIPGLYEGPIYVLSLYLSHALFELDSEILTYELGVDGDDLYDFVPQLEYLGPHLIEVLHQLKGDLVWIAEIDPL